MANSELVYGIHAVEHALRHSAEHILELWLQSDNQNKNIDQIQKMAQIQGLAVHRVPRKTLDKLAQGQRHQGVVLRQRAGKMLDEGDLLAIIDQATSPVLLLVLDGVQDPHNLGACLRTADAAGVNAVVIPLSRGVSLTATVRKVASGAADAVPLVAVHNLARTLKTLQDLGVWMIGTSDQAQLSIYDVDMTGPVALIMGAEDKGLRRLTQEHCDFLVQLPMAGVVESLNVSVASGIGLYEAVRQRRS